MISRSSNSVRPHDGHETNSVLMLRMRLACNSEKEVQKSGAYRPLARSGHRHCCRPSRWNQSWFLLVVSFRSRRPCPWSSVSFFRDFKNTSFVCKWESRHAVSTSKKLRPTLCGFRNGGFVFSAFKVDHQANRFLGKITNWRGTYEIPTTSRRQESIQTMSWHKLTVPFFYRASSKLMIATALSSRSFIRTSAGTITPTFTSIIRRNAVRPSLSLLGGLVCI